MVVVVMLTCKNGEMGRCVAGGNVRGAEALSKGLGEDAGDAVRNEEMSSCESLSLRGSTRLPSSAFPTSGPERLDFKLSQHQFNPVHPIHPFIT